MLPVDSKFSATSAEPQRLEGKLPALQISLRSIRVSRAEYQLGSDGVSAAVNQMSEFSTHYIAEKHVLEAKCAIAAMH